MSYRKACKMPIAVTSTTSEDYLHNLLKQRALYNLLLSLLGDHHREQFTTVPETRSVSHNSISKGSGLIMFALSRSLKHRFVDSHSNFASKNC